jgi:AraC-like DNA-binding protein
MKKLFEPVYIEQGSLFWDHRIRIEDHFRGYYHWHQICEFVLVHEGQGTVVVNQQAFEIRKGMFFFFQPFQLHQVYAEVSPEHPYVRSIFYADPLLIERLLRGFPNRHSRFQALWQSSNRAHAWDLGESAKVMEGVFDQYDEARRSGKGENLEELSLLFLQMLSRLPEHGYGGVSEKEKQEHTNVRRLRYSEIVMRWIEEHYHERVNMDRLAKELHLSNNYISRVFREETGGSITDYVTARRMKQACRLLETTDYGVERIAREVGFENDSYFIQLFKREVGSTPLKYRNARLQEIR